MGRYDDVDAARRLAAMSDVVTYELEHVGLEAAAAAGELAPLRPGPRRAARDPGPAGGAAVHPGHRRADGARGARSAASPRPRRPPRRWATRSGSSCRWAATTGARQVRITSRARGRGRGGGPRRRGRPAAAAGAGDRLRGGALGRVRARTATGGRWPSRSSRNVHDAGILAESVAPAPIDPIVANDAREIADSIARGLDLVGRAHRGAVPAPRRRADDQRAGAAGAQHAATGPSRGRPRRSSSSTCARSWGCRWGPWRRTA